MGQDSLTTRKLFHTGKTKEGFLTPTLSSPIFCLVDICVDCYLLIIALLKFRDRDALTESVILPDFDSAPSNITPLVAVRILLIVFGVLPQAVRLYGMSGIPITQAVATSYLATSLLRLLRNRIVPSDDEENEGEEDNENASGDMSVLRIVTVSVVGPGFLVLSHFPAYIYLLDGASQLVYTDHLDAIKRDLIISVKPIISLVCCSLCFLGSLLWIAYIFLDIFRPIQRCRPIYLWFVVLTIGYMGSWVDAMTKEKSANFNISVDSVLSAILTACLLGALLKSLLEVANGQLENADGIDTVSIQLNGNNNGRATIEPL